MGMIVGIAIGAAVLLGGTIMVAHEFMFILDRVRTNAPVARDSVKAPTPPRPRRALAARSIRAKGAMENHLIHLAQLFAALVCGLALWRGDRPARLVGLAYGTGFAIALLAFNGAGRMSRSCRSCSMRRSWRCLSGCRCAGGVSGSPWRPPAC
ncbi:hypothetical protein [Caulobacter sp. B11]|uniref:hypothetical protein n=1 Tax=Caulobacter sp. B11 TaxID=2048899 RepID=UPI001F29DA25|nr:hypothetical protein [Caulobacter sp. B11]